MTDNDFSDLDFGYHLNIYRSLLTGIDKLDAQWHRRAEYMHTLSVCDALSQAHLDVVQLAENITKAEAKMHLNFGVGRRTKFIWLSVRHLLDLIHPERSDPLPHDDVEDAAIDLNVIYINIRGTLDNFCWSLLSLFGTSNSHEQVATRPSIVNLFNSDFLKLLEFEELSSIVGVHSIWNKDLKARRDPAAHRIPLSVIPSILDEKSLAEHQRTYAEWITACNRALAAAKCGEESANLFEQADVLHKRLQSIGTFHPLFGHDPKEGMRKIYPLVPLDVGILVKICKALTSAIGNKLDARRAIMDAIASRPKF